MYYRVHDSNADEARAANMVVGTISRHEVHNGSHRREDPTVHVSAVEIGSGETHWKELVFLTRIWRSEEIKSFVIVREPLTGSGVDRLDLHVILKLAVSPTLSIIRQKIDVHFL